MKLFSLNILLFLTCGILLNFLAYIFIAKSVLYRNYYPPIKELKTYKCFLLSDSHGNAIEKKDLSELGIYNFSFDGDSYKDMILKLNFLINNANPETIFITVDDHSLSPYREQMSNRSRSISLCNKPIYIQLYGGNNIKYMFEKYINPYFPLLNTNNSKLFYSYIYSHVVSLIKSKNHNESIEKFSNLTSEQKIKASQNRVEYQFPQKEFSTTLRDTLKQIILMSRKNAINLIGIKFPLTKNYIDALGLKSYNADGFAKNQGLKILDFKKIFMNKDHLFKNQDHLNKFGSKRFTLHLAKKCTGNHIFCDCK